MSLDFAFTLCTRKTFLLSEPRHRPPLIAMVSFSCEACGDILKKPKLDQHAGRCRGAYYTCIDCNTTFDGPVGANGYRSHTSCVSEEQRYHKSVYKEPKKKGKQNKQNQNQNQNQPQEQAAATAAPAPAAAPAVPDHEESKKRAREEETPQKTEEVPTVTPDAKNVESSEAKATEGESEEPSKKKKKKSKKNKEEGAADSSEPKQETLASFLSSALPAILSESVSIISMKEKVVARAKEKGFTDEKEVEKALFAGMSVGGKKSKVKYEFA
ncbi:uncharacterized protein JCM15063_002702 [Sporobolomyces koalae]|uniref:uncharacterized protein n=1 Tax=Sporobolomyces koalae TaxID=500713 RepID=UPI0031805682